MDPIFQPHELVSLPLSDLTRYPNNPRKNDDAVLAIAASIKEYGFLIPILIDERKQIICGDTRYQAAHALGLTTAPCIYATNLTPAQVKAFRVLDNKLSEKAKWDYERLQLELEDLDLTLPVITMAFAQHELDTIMQAEWTPPPIVEDEPAAPSAGSTKSSLAVQFTAAQWAVVHEAILHCREQMNGAPSPDARCLELICADYMAGVRADA